MIKKAFSFTLVTLQFLCILLLLFTSKIKNLHLVSFVLMIIGIIIGLWAIYVMRNSILTIMPDLITGSSMIIFGPYRFVRHPMYLAVLIFCLALAITHFDLPRAGIFFLLLITLLVKIEYEEKQLITGFKGYHTYMQKTRKLLPCIY